MAVNDSSDATPYDEKEVLLPAHLDTGHLGSHTPPLPFFPPHLSYHNYINYVTEQASSSLSLESSIDEKRDWGNDDLDPPRAVRRGFWVKFTKRHAWLFPAGVVVVLVLFLVTFQLGHRSAFSANAFVAGKQEITMEHVFNGTFSPRSQHFLWLPEAGGSVYAVREANMSITLHDLAEGTTRQLIGPHQVVDEHGTQIAFGQFWVSADACYVLLQTNFQKQWRWSSLAKYYIHNLETHSTYPLVADEEATPRTSLAVWAPTTRAIAYVNSNDLFILQEPQAGSSPIQLTWTGSPSVYNGRPDWVHEEETFEDNKALWWSPDSTKLAYLAFNDTAVPEYDYAIYNPSLFFPGLESPYPSYKQLRYPKPGYTNPQVTLRVFDLSVYSDSPSRPSTSESSTERIAAITAATVELNVPSANAEAIFTEVTWVSSTELIVKQTDRAGSTLTVAHFDLSRVSPSDAVLKGTVLSKTDFAKLDGGWVEPMHSVRPAWPFKLSGLKERLPQGYLDVLPAPNGFQHIAFFPTATTTEPVWLTWGDWEVAGPILSVDVARRRVWFLAAQPSMERHLYSVALPTDGQQDASGSMLRHTINDTQTCSVSFSPDGRFYLYSSEGPGVPWQQLIDVDGQHPPRLITENKELASRLQSVALPTRQNYELAVGNQTFNVLEVRPPKFDDSGRVKYPVLFRPYGGPGSQTASTSFPGSASLAWSYHLAAAYGFIVVSVDGRGTGYKGRAFRNPVRHRLGEYEAQDQIDAARHYASLSYVDEAKIGIFGWSYGGYLTAKVLEANSGVFSLGISIAPVTDWRFYDSVYTERYMGLYDENVAGYTASAVTNMMGFHNVSLYLASGSADDNVHMPNVMALLDRLTYDQVRGFRFRLFTDSDHSISTRGAYRELFEDLTAFLKEHWVTPKQRKDD